MSTLTMAGHVAHGVSGGDWHSWLVMLGVLVACWTVALLATTALFAGPTHARRPHTRGGTDHGVEDVASMHVVQGRRHV
ncbi:hypothetical protein H7J08_12680 [Mycobacterium frederiksbergense]|uniref:hypothetical protein n=1 Tax=Mycobacteriaceae TaxID=1762 RepID=UPI0021F39BC2|nr:hypothetical protein [Mycolicibacterium frederiksbergense]MBX9918863.1 hypothetical protein [Mycolicibacterium frederiksbergense]MCV7045520.1 hypothetical protein [Mycolicibacterium frederiksbergense]